MKTLRNKTTHLARLLFEDQETVHLGPDGLKSRQINDVEITSDVYEIVEAPAPIHFIRETLSFDQTWQVTRPDAFDLLANPVSEDLIRDCKTRARVGTTELLEVFTADVSHQEVVSWPTKAQAARAYTAGTPETHHLNLLEAEAEIYGETIEVLCQKILAKAQLYEDVLGFCTGLKRRTENALEIAKPSEMFAIMNQFEADLLAKKIELGINAT